MNDDGRNGQDTYNTGEEGAEHHPDEPMGASFSELPQGTHNQPGLKHRPSIPIPGGRKAAVQRPTEAEPTQADVLHNTQASMDFDFMVSVSNDNSPGPLMSPINQRALLESVSNRTPGVKSQQVRWQTGPIAQVSAGNAVQPTLISVQAGPAGNDNASRHTTAIDSTYMNGISAPTQHSFPFLQSWMGHTALERSKADHTQNHSQDEESSTPNKLSPSHSRQQSFDAGLQSWSATHLASYDPNQLLQQEEGSEYGEDGNYRGAYYHPTPPRQKLSMAASGSSNQQQQPHIPSRNNQAGFDSSSQHVPSVSKQNQSQQLCVSNQVQFVSTYMQQYNQQCSANGSALPVLQEKGGPTPEKSDSHNKDNLTSASPRARNPSQGGKSTRLTRAIRPRQSAIGTYLTELFHLLKLALPCVVIIGSAQVVIVASQIYAGQLGTLELAAAAMGNALWLVAYYCFIGTCIALETLGSQAVGAANHGLLVTWTMTAAIVCTVLALPIAGTLWNADALASSLLGQTDPTTCIMVRNYCRGLAVGLLPQAWAIVLSKHMQAQSQMVLPGVACAATALSFLSFVPHFVSRWGLVGIAAAASAGRAVQLLVMLLMVAGFETYKGTQWFVGATWARCWARWQLARRRRTLVTFLGLAGPGCLGCSLESAGWEVTTAMAAYLGTLQVAVHASALSVATLVIMCVPMALAVAANIRIARLLGSGLGRQALVCSRLAVTLGLSGTGGLGVLLYYKRADLGWLFTSHDIQMVELLASIAPLVAVYQGIAGLLGSTQGVLRGVGHQGTVVVATSVGLAVGTLLGAYLTWGPRQMGLYGLWAGSVAGVAVTATMNLLALLLVDWRYEVAAAQGMQAMMQGVRARHHVMARALQDDEVADETLVEALLAEAHSDPRPLTLIYQDYAWARNAAGASARRAQGSSNDATASAV